MKNKQNFSSVEKFLQNFISSMMEQSNVCVNKADSLFVASLNNNFVIGRSSWAHDESNSALQTWKIFIKSLFNKYFN